MRRDRIYKLLDAERNYQNTIHPMYNPAMILAVLVEEVGEVAQAVQNNDIMNLKAELLQLAAVCIRWLEEEF